VGVVRTYKIDGIALHSLKPHPNIGLDVLHDVADVKVAIGVWQSGGDEKLALGCHVCKRDSFEAKGVFYELSLHF
jgi:hypothetical protein